jgi:molybdenum cofactor biosynthesis protein B
MAHDPHSHDGHSHDGHSHDGHSHDGHSHDGHSHDGHDGHSHDAQTSVGVYVITCSDTRTAATDEGGQLVRSLAQAAGHSLIGADLVKDDLHAITQALDHALAHGARAIIFTGGTGIARRDVTLEALEPRFDKRLDGFGELFRALSFNQVGAAAFASRAAAGVVQGALVFALPGAPRAVRLAMDKLILPQLGHLVRELVK